MLQQQGFYHKSAISSAPCILQATGIEGYDGHVARFNKWNKGQAITASRILLFLQTKQGLAPSTISCYLQAIKKAIKQSLTDTRQLTLLDNFFKQIKTAKTDKKIYQEELLSEGDMAKLIQAMPIRLALICEALYRTGLRISELLAIRLEDTQRQGDFVYVRIIGKGKKERRIILSHTLYKKIIKAFASQELLFASPRGGSYSREYIARQVAKYARLILDRHIHPHSFRHSFATSHILRKGSVKAVANYLGHSSTSITEQMYNHDQMQAAELWPKMEAKSA